MTLQEFNREINPSNSNVYLVESSGQRTDRLSLNEVKIIAGRDSNALVKMHIPKGFMVIHVKEPEVLKIIQDKSEPVMVVESNGEYDIWCKSNLNTDTTNNLLACGLNANTIAKKGTEAVVPFINRKFTTNQYYTNTQVVYANGIRECPVWLRPLLKKSNSVATGFQVPIVNNAPLILNKHLTQISGLNKYDKLDVINVINTYFIASPMTQQEVENLIAILDNQLLESFVDKGNLMHWKLGDYVINACNIKRDEVSKELYYYDQHKKIYTNDSDFLMGYLTKLIPQLKQYQKEETQKYILNTLYDDQVQFNKDEYTVVFKNGVLDLSTWTFESMSPDHLESIQINCDYDPTAYSKTADEFFATATCGNKDVEQLLYEAIGYAMLKTNSLAKSFILTGTGRNGKSTFLDIIKTILGKRNYASISFKDLESNFRVSQLKDKLASLAGDISNQPIKESDLFKSISAFEDITIEEKYKQAYTDKLFSTLFFACNRLPRTPDTSMGFYRRMVIIPFDADLSKISTVAGVQFASRLKSQESINYIAYKALQAIYNVLNTTQEFTQPQCVTDMLERYKVDNSTVLSWFWERFKADEDKLKSINIAKAYGNYSQWCTEAGRMASSKTTFVQQVKAEIGIDLPNT